MAIDSATRMAALTSVLGMHQAHMHVDCQPGIVIFVHGVNSDGEWYEACERGLIDGLNHRLGFDRALQPDLCLLRAAEYHPELLPDGSINRQLGGKNFIADPGRSPVIRFRWGYKVAGEDNTDPEAVDENKEYKQSGKTWLNEMDAWGGGPFQNGTTALPYMWGVGLDDRVFWWLYTNMFPVEGREVYASPPRAYFAHAAHRLKELIKAIRDKQADCPITVVCHSQGNMVTLAAALLGEKEDAIADTYIMSNPPYSLESLGMDKMVNHDHRGLDSRSAVGQFGSVTTEARMTTFSNFLEAVRARAGVGQAVDAINNKLEFKDAKSGEQVFKLAEFPSDPHTLPPPGIDRDNRGRVFLYCNPHDQVIGVTPVQGIGWKGVSAAQFAALNGEGVLHQRVWAQPGGNQAPPFQIGSPDWKAYRYIADNHNPKQFWTPRPPMMRFALSLNESQGAVSRILSVTTAPIIWLITRLFNIPINDDPPKDWIVPINAPLLREPISPASMRYGQTGAFDQEYDPAADALAKAGGDAPREAPYDRNGQGDAGSEAQLRYEHRARIEAAKRRGAIGNSEEDERAAIARMLKENPNATDHSTILTNPAHAEKVLAYDVAVGWLDHYRITAEDMQQFRMFAHWMFLKEAKPNKEVFEDYWKRGLFKGHQVKYTYNLDHMVSQAPGIVDARERSLLGYVK